MHLACMHLTRRHRKQTAALLSEALKSIMRYLFFAIFFLISGCSLNKLPKNSELVDVNDVKFTIPQGFRVLRTGNSKVQRALKKLKDVEKEDAIFSYVIVENDHTDSEPKFGVFFMLVDLPIGLLQAVNCEYKSLMTQFLSSNKIDYIHPFGKDELKGVVISNLGDGYRKIEYNVHLSSKKDDLVQYITFNEGKMVAIGLSKGRFSTRSDENEILEEIKGSVVFKPVDICAFTVT
ncbi:hypothetical protein A9Q99_13960 [Gammaproteobacteria bacterium 45_16_T64]|nr:hypothetical protein A9Q99_13960 [Gammaproteobacteria bacterium 45_16_T64]